MRFSILQPLAALSLIASCATASGLEPSEFSYDKDGRPVAQAVVNERQSFDFVIDTAAQSSMVGPEIISALDLKPDPDRKAQVQGASGVILVNLYPIKSIRMGDFAANDLFVPTSQHNSPSEAAGILGADVFGKTGVTLDFRNGVASIGKPKLVGETIDLQFRFGSIAIAQIEIGGAKASAVIDTGARHSIGNLQLLEALDVDKDALTSSTKPIGVSGHKATSLGGFSGNIKIGEANLESAAITFSDASIFNALGLNDQPAIILGMDVLKRLDSIAIDYEASTLIIAAD